MDLFTYNLSHKKKITKPIRLIELFGGIGSQAKALKKLNANFDHYRLVEFDEKAIKSYNAIHNTNFSTLDITKISASDLRIVDTDKYEYIMTYSFPCQDISLAGKREGMKKGGDTRSGLLWEVERLLNEYNGYENLPQILLMENVPQVHSKNNVKDFYQWLVFLESLGYKNYWKDLNSKNYGIPQNRNRTFMVSLLGDCLYEFPKKKKLKLRLKDMLEDEVDEKYYLSDKQIEAYSDKSVEKILNNIVDVNGVSNTITANPQRATIDSATLLVVYQPHLRIRKLTPKECWRLMGFSDEDFERASKLNSNSQLYKQAGNSIVVNVLEEIFKKLL